MALSHSARACAGDPLRTRSAKEKEIVGQSSSTLSRGDAGESTSHGAFLQEVVVQVDPRDAKLPTSSHTKIKKSGKNAPSRTLGSCTAQNAGEMMETVKPHLNSHTGIKMQLLSPAFGGEDLRLAKRREERLSSRAVQPSCLSAAAAEGSTTAALQPHHKSHSGAEILGPPPPFDFEDQRLAIRREERLSARTGRRRR